jgi:hypothetical protein
VYKVLTQDIVKIAKQARKACLCELAWLALCELAWRIYEYVYENFCCDLIILM